MGKWRSMNDVVIYFDGVCYLCNSVVNLLIKIDGEKKLKFSPLQSNYAKNNLLDRGTYFSTVDSIILQKEGKYYIKSEAIIEIIKQLNWYWMIFLIGRILPKNLRDSLYDFVANNRYKWFGKKDVCMIPTDDVKSRFILN